MLILQPMSIVEGIIVLLSFFITVVPPFLGTTYTGLTHALLEIGYITPTSSHFSTSLQTTSFMVGFSHLCASTEGL